MISAQALTIPHAFNSIVATISATQVSDILASAVQWMAASVFGALFCWWLIIAIFQRRRQRQATDRGTLYISLFLMFFAMSNLIIESRTFALHESLAAAPAIILFALFFYLFSDERYAPRWTRWLSVIYVFSFIGAFVPQKSGGSNAQITFTPPPGVIGIITAIFTIVALLIVLSGVIAQIYYRYRHFALTGERWAFQRHTKILVFCALPIASFLALLVSSLLSQINTASLSPLLLSLEMVYYLLVTLLPATASLLLLHQRPYDRSAAVNRLLIFGLLILCLLAIYVVFILTLWFLFPGFRTLQSYDYMPFLILIGLLMALSFRPLHRQITERINRRFFRHTYEAARQITAFTATLHDDMQLEQVSGQLISVIQKSLQSAPVILWLQSAPELTVLRAPSGKATVISSGRTPSERQDQAFQLHRQAGAASAQPANATLAVSADDPIRPMLLRPSSVLNLSRPAADFADSATVRALQAAGLAIALPLVSQNELVGLLALGPRASARRNIRYTFDELELLTKLADRVAPVLRMAQLTHAEEVDARQRERVEQELQTARRIQEALLPKSTPTLSGWQLATCYQPAREVGGDFYDFLPLADGRLGIVLGDVTDKGIPAALVMATTRSMLRAVAMQPGTTPGQALAQVNELLCADLPPSMFVTCFYAILDPLTGNLQYANAGQDLPYLRHKDGTVGEVRATGMPLGLMPNMRYDEGETALQPGDSLLFYSDGLVEAHNPQRQMFGLPHLMALLGEHSDGTPPILFLLHELADFTGPDWDQEDDITLVVLQRLEGNEGNEGNTQNMNNDSQQSGAAGEETNWRTLDEWTLASEPGNERQAIQRVAEAVRDLGIPARRLEQLKTAVGEATMNAMEHGNNYRPDLPVIIQVRASQVALAVRISDEGGDTFIESPAPDLEAKLAGLQSQRGWGMFLIRSLVDEVRVSSDGTHHTVELILWLTHQADAGEETNI